MSKIYTNQEKLDYYKNLAVEIRAELARIDDKIKDLAYLCTFDPSGVSFQNWKKSNEELVALAKRQAGK